MISRFAKITAILSVALASAACTRIETGEIGVRIDAYKNVQPGELNPGGVYQTIIGDVLIFPVKDIIVKLDNMQPVAKDNSTMQDFDMTFNYSIVPTAASELYSSKSRSYHALAEGGDVLLMYNYMVQLARNAAYKAAREHEALAMGDKRQEMEDAIRDEITRQLASEGLNGKVTPGKVLIRNTVPAQTVVDSANALVRAKNELAQREVEVKTAEAEARRMAALSAQSAQSIEYMKAQAALNISEGVKNGKVQTIIVPSTFTGLMMNK